MIISISCRECIVTTHTNVAYSLVHVLEGLVQSLHSELDYRQIEIWTEVYTDVEFHVAV